MQSFGIKCCWHAHRFFLILWSISQHEWAEISYLLLPRSLEHYSDTWNCFTLWSEHFATWKTYSIHSCFLYFREINSSLLQWKNCRITAMNAQASQILRYHKRAIIWNSSAVQVLTTKTHLGGVLEETKLHKLILLAFILWSHIVCFSTTTKTFIWHSKWNIDMKYSCSTSGKIIDDSIEGDCKQQKSRSFSLHPSQNYVLSWIWNRWCFAKSR